MEKLKGNFKEKKNMNLTLKLFVNGERNYSMLYVHDVMDSISNLCLGPQASTIRDNIETGMMMRIYSNKEFHSLQEFEAGEVGGGFGKHRISGLGFGIGCHRSGFVIICHRSGSRLRFVIITDLDSDQMSRLAEVTGSAVSMLAGGVRR